jgi:hypothetical protein
MKSTYTNTLERGILTSTYKREIRQNAFDIKRESLSKVKTFLTNSPSILESQTATILRVSLFVIAIVMINL